ncbi:MAG TPA: N-acetylmuramoyl-L-alanine amidase [Gemmatimonadales bacterium]|jgi:N-acetylmuramoyl-L-alanine amidase
MVLARWGRLAIPALAAVACAPGRPSNPAPRENAPVASAPALPEVPHRTGPLDIRVVYPQPDAVMQFRDSTFIFGSVGTGDARLVINGQTVPVWPNGAWLAYLALPPDTVARFQLDARTTTDSASLTYVVRRTIPDVPPAGVTAWIDTLSLAPRGQVWLAPDEYLPLSVRATEGADVRLRLIDGTVIPLVPQPQLAEVSEGVRVFGAGRPDTWRRDRYSGELRGRPIGPDPGTVLGRGDSVSVSAAPGSWPTVEAIVGTDTARARWPLQVALLDTVPVVVEFDDDTAHVGTTDSTTIGRASPGATYAWFFPTGTRAQVTGRRNGDVRLRLSRSAEAWVPAADARALPSGVPAPHGTVGSITITSTPGYERVRVPVSQRVPFRIVEGERALSIRLFGAVGDVNFIRYGATDSLVRRLSWEQTAADEVAITLELARPVWGYRTRWEGDDLLFDVRRPPMIDAGRPLSGRLIAVDPGHPPAGATGPTGLREAEANLAVAVIVKRLLEADGARVLMTRTSDIPLDLWPRVAMAERADADVLVSIHNNALPDGVNPFAHNGTSVYYNHPRSIPLARDIQAELLKVLELRDLGIGRGDLALVRGTWMPSVLTEGLFIMVPDQEAALRTSRGQELYARAVVAGLRRFLGEQARTQ